MNRSKKELLKRYTFFIIGLFVNAFGVSFITKAQLGTSPISSVPYTLSIGFPLTMGTLTFILNMILIIGQVALLKKDFEIIQLMQIPISIIFGFFIDLTMSLLSFLNPTTYTLKILFLLIGCIILAFGVTMEVIANVVMLSGEAFVKAISSKCNKEFGITKVFFDVTLVLISCILSFVLFKTLMGVREGTIAAALIVGFTSKSFNKIFGFIEEKWLMEQESMIEGIADL